MLKYQIAPSGLISLSRSISVLLLWFTWTGHCQYYDPPYGPPPYYDDFGEPDYYPPEFSPLPEGAPVPQAPYSNPPPAPSSYNNFNLFNPFLPTGQGQGQQQGSQPQQQLQGSYPNFPQFPFQTVTPNNNQNNNLNNNNNNLPKVNRYPFPGSFGSSNTNANNNNNNLNSNSLNPLQPSLTPAQQQLQSSSFANALLNLQYPKLPNLPFQTVTPQQPQPQPSIIPLLNNFDPNFYQNQKPKIELPRIRVIEFPASTYFEYGGGKLVQPKRPNSDLYIGGVGGDAPINSKIFIECTGPNQVEWMFSGNGTTKKDLSVVTKPFQITIPEERGPTPGSREYTYLRLGLEQQISESDAGVYTCRDRVLPQNYITIRVIVAKPVTGRPNYPFKPKDPNTIYYSSRDSFVVLPCKIEDSNAVISLHKHEGGKLSCPYTVDGRVRYDRYKGFIIQTRAFNDLEGRYVCVGDFDGELRLMKYKLVRSEDFATRYVEGEPQNIIALDSEPKKSSTSAAGGSSSSSSSSAFLASLDSFPNSILSGLTGSSSDQDKLNLTAAGLLDPRSEFEIETDESFTLPKPQAVTSPKKDENDDDKNSNDNDNSASKDNTSTKKAGKV